MIIIEYIFILEEYKYPIKLTYKFHTVTIFTNLLKDRNNILFGMSDIFSNKVAYKMTDIRQLARKANSLS